MDGEEQSLLPQQYVPGDAEEELVKEICKYVSTHPRTTISSSFFNTGAVVNAEEQEKK